MMAGRKQTKLRVIFLNRFYWPDESATAQLLTDLAESLAETGFSVEIATSRLRYDTACHGDTLPPESVQKGVKIRRLWSTRFGRIHLPGRLMDYLSIYGSFFLYLLREAGPNDIVVCKTDPPLLSTVGWLAGLFRPFRMVTWCQDVFPEVAEHALPPFPGKAPVLGALKVLRDLSFNACDRVVAISSDMERMIHRLGMRVPVSVIPNWAIQEATAVAPAYTQLRKDWDLSERIILGYSGNLGRAHDIETILKALPDLAQLERLTLLFIGGGKGYEVLQEHAAGHPRELLRFLPYQAREHLAQTLKVPHIHWFSLQPEMTEHILPSKFYGILEAGRPMIFLGQVTSSLAHFIEDSGCGVAVPSGDAGQFVEAVQRLYTAVDLCEQMGTASRALAEGSCSRSNRLGQWGDLLHQLAGGPSPSGGHGA